MGVHAVQKTEADAIIEHLLALDDAPARAQLVRQYPVVAWDEIVTTLTEKAWQEVRIDTHRAKRLADAALDVAQTIGSPSLLARSFRAKANAMYALDDHTEAIQLHERAIALFEQTGEEAELARTLSGSIQPLLLLGRYDQAIAAGERASAIFRQQGNTRRLARLEINLGNIYHRQDRFAEALAFYERAYEQLLAHDDAEGLAAVLSNLSLCHISLNDFPKALELHQVARRHCEQKAMPILVAYADYNIAYLYFLRGEYGRSIQMLRDASVSAKKAQDAYQLALCNLDLSEIYLELNLSAEAGELGRAANEAFHELGFGYEAAKALGFAAIAASRQGQAFEAVKLFARAKEMFVQDHNQVWPSLIDLYEALVLFTEGRLFEARRLCAAAHEFFRTSTSMRGKAVLAELLLARIALRLGDSNLAKQHCGRALTDLASLDSPTLLYQAEFLAGEVERATGNDDAAYQSYRRARAAVERLRSSLRGEELKIAFFENKLEVYESLVDLCLRRRDSFEEAFAYIEQAKSRTLMDLLNQPVHVPTAADPGQSELVRSIRNLREELNWYYNLIEREQLRPEERSQARVQQLEQQARSRESDLMKAIKEATVAEANEAGLQVPSNLSLEDIRSVIAADTALIEFFCAHDRIVVCVLTRDELHICPVTVQPRIQKLLQLLQFQMSKFRLDPQYVATFSQPLLESTDAHLKSLYRELIAPIRHLLDARHAVQHVVFLQHGLLHYVPFHALHDGDSYLIDRFTISYAPSASIYAHCQTRHVNTDAAGTSLILGVPDERTPAILAEVNALAQILPNARVFMGDDATEDVLRTYGPQSKSVHIATHGYFRQDNPMFSSIRLGTSHLSLYDMAHLQLPVELIALSGCATGLNVVTPGDELMGLVRGLLQAGAQSLVLSLWDVHDDSTKEFMVEFYNQLQQGFSKARAIQTASVRLRESRPHPYYWAPFLLIGKD